MYTKAEIAGVTGKLHCLGKHVLCMKSHIAEATVYNNEVPILANSCACYLERH
jgi:hypothetical protein